MKIGIIGSGNIGGNLGKHFAKAGHEVFFSSRNPEKLSGLVNEIGERAHRGTVEEAATFGEVILLATPYGMLPEVHERIGNLQGKTLIDTTNFYVQRDGTEIKKQMSAQNQRESEWTAHYFKGASVSKAFNTIPAAQLRDEAFKEEGMQEIIPFAAGNKQAKEIIEQLISDIGFKPAFIGGLSKTKVMEPDQELYMGFPAEEKVKAYTV
ncbi:NAD(P)-binding domain-containing protein [Aquimarina sp. U1-2]|uniref:NADPH-dependent F420 reductase n=1 Tax=Aquimarina sp. U1-2 TaxID=2823141 RepID=UPI001AECD275|nr:NAD(P)-binding domain-containing protein [Aquimarina sp. U1-2]MBP2833765.1 NAD(P)-binding domain-containing protein [Aquimarina sp. U1-2]